MKMLKKVALVAGALVLAAGVSVAQAADLKVAVVNVQQLLQQSPRVAELSKKLEDKFKGRQNKIGEEQKSLQEKLEKFKKESPTMAKKSKESEEKKLADDRADLVKKVVAYQQDLQKEQNKIMQDILKDLNDTVKKIAKKDSYALVLDSQAVIYAGDSSDITKEVEKAFNK